jgi:hypothetical protein
LAAFTLTACPPSTVGDYPRGAVVVAPLPSRQGWSSVEEPGWFAAAMPGAPTTTFESIALADSHLQVKALSATDGQRVWTWIRYFEVSTLTTMLDPEALMRAGRDDFLGIAGVTFLREEPRQPSGPTIDFVCTVAPHSPLDASDSPMIARVRGYGRFGAWAHVVFAIAVWPAEASDQDALAFFDAFRVGG